MLMKPGDLIEHCMSRNIYLLIAIPEQRSEELAQQEFSVLSVCQDPCASELRAFVPGRFYDFFGACWFRPLTQSLN